MADYNTLTNDPPLLNLGNVVSFEALNTFQDVHFGVLGSRVPGIVKRTLYRGKVGPDYVYAVDTPPPGATNVIVIGITYDE